MMTSDQVISMENADSVSAKEKIGNTKSKKSPEDGNSNFQWLTLVRLISTLVIACVAVYWIYQVLCTYNSQPVSSSVIIKHNKTFKWPSVILDPYAEFNSCVNKTKMKEVSLRYNLTLTKGVYFPFDLNASIDFDWEHNNLSDLIFKATDIQWKSLFSGCELSNGNINYDCSNKSSHVGKWNTYLSNTYDGGCGFVYEFTPTSTTKDKYASIKLNFTTDILKSCGAYSVVFLPSTELYYEDSATIKYFKINPGENHIFTVTVEEFNNVNKKAVPCEEDINYSKNECIKNRAIKNVISDVGCYIPAFTGYQKFLEDYPECNERSECQTFITLYDWISEYGNVKYEEQHGNQQSPCPDQCHVQMYKFTHEIKESGDNSSSAELRLDPSAMIFLQVNEKFDMTTDTLIGNIGGTLGLFLGVSFLTGINAMEFIVKLVINLHRKHLGNYIL